MKNRESINNIIYLGLFLFLIVITSSIARFTINKKHDGNINISNHPGTSGLGKGAEYILNKEGGLNNIKARGVPYFSKNLSIKPAYESAGVRPVINLKPDIVITSGDGTEDKPFIIN